MGVAPSARCVDDFKLLMKKYITFLNELTLLIDQDTPDEFMEKLEEVKEAVRNARTNYWFYPWIKTVATVDNKFAALRQTFPSKDFIPQERNKEFAVLATELHEETIRLNELYAQECKGSLLLGCAAGFFDYFLVDVLLSNFEFLTTTFKQLEGYGKVAKGCAAAKAFVISAITKGLGFIGFSPATAAIAAPVVLSTLIAITMVLLAMHFYPTACRDLVTAIWNIFVFLGLAVAAPAAVPPPVVPPAIPPAGP